MRPQTLQTYSSGVDTQRETQNAFTLALTVRGFASQVCALHLSRSGACGSFYLVGGTALRQAQHLAPKPPLALPRAASLRFCDLTPLFRPSGGRKNTMSILLRRTSRTVQWCVFCLCPGLTAARELYLCVSWKNRCARCTPGALVLYSKRCGGVRPKCFPSIYSVEKTVGHPEITSEKYALEAPRCVVVTPRCVRFAGIQKILRFGVRENSFAAVRHGCGLGARLGAPQLTNSVEVSFRPWRSRQLSKRRKKNLPWERMGSCTPHRGQPHWPTEEAILTLTIGNTDVEKP